ncbi:MAG TPA: hypothetical protein VJA21_27920 [Verrucomicrobiae bacterium]
MQFTEADRHQAGPLDEPAETISTPASLLARHRCWSCLENIPDLVALPATWQEAWGHEFAAFRTLCLQSTASFATAVRCPDCGCLHSVIHRHDHTGAIGIRRCDPPDCPDIILTLPDITLLEVNLARFGRGLCVAFGFDSKTAEFPLPHTAQFGAWSARAVPAVLTIQRDQLVFRRVAADLAARLARPFMLFAPTSAHLDAEVRAAFETHGTAFFTLESSVVLEADGTLQALNMPVMPTRWSPDP